MYNIKKITDDLFWVGANDRKIALFESVYPVPSGISYNSYILKDEKTVLLDTVDKATAHQFMENVEHALNGKKLDYLVINHMEPDHCAEIATIISKYSDVKIVCNAKTQVMLHQFFNFNLPEEQFVIVKEGDTLNMGKHTLTFFMAPMVHWPEVMITYDTTDKILFSADAFGTFGAIDGNIFADDIDFDGRYMDEMRRYYTNIVGKYGTQVQMLLKKLANIDIDMICPLHGYVLRKNLEKFIDKYQKWSTYTPETNSVLVVYTSVYGNTQNAAEILAGKLAEFGIKNIKMYDASTVHPSYIVSDAFKYSHLAFVSTTYNNGIFVNMENLLHDIVAHCLQNRRIALIDNGSWAPTCGKGMAELLSQLKNCEIISEPVSIKSSVKEENVTEITKLAEQIKETMAL